MTASSPQWQPSSVALSRCTQSDDLLLLLLHPSPDVLDPPSAAPQAPAALLARCATRCLHRVLFADARVCAALRESRVHCVLARSAALPAPLSEILSTLPLELPHVAPALLVFAPTSRRVLFCESGYVSPNTLLAVLPSSACAVASKPLNATRSQRAPSPPPVVRAELPSAALNLRASVPPSVRIRVRLPSGQIEHVEKPAPTPFAHVRQHVATLLRAPPHHLLFSHAAPPNVPISVADDASSLAELRLAPAAALIVSLREHNVTPPSTAATASLWTRFAAVRSVARAFVSSFFAQAPEPTQREMQQRPSSSRDSSSAPRAAPRLGDVRDNGNSTQFAYRPNAEEQQHPSSPH